MGLGIGSAALIEHASVADVQWTYNRVMTLVAFFAAGLWSFLPMAILRPLTFCMAARLSGWR